MFTSASETIGWWAEAEVGKRVYSDGSPRDPNTQGYLQLQFRIYSVPAVGLGPSRPPKRSYAPEPLNKPPFIFCMSWTAFDLWEATISFFRYCLTRVSPARPYFCLMARCRALKPYTLSSLFRLPGACSCLGEAREKAARRI